MYKLIVLTDPDTADGFRLAGVDVHVASSPDQAREHLNALVDEDARGMLAYYETSSAELDQPPPDVAAVSG